MAKNGRPKIYDKRKPFLISVDNILHQNFKNACFRKGITMSEAINIFIKEYVRSNDCFNTTMTLYSDNYIKETDANTLKDKDKDII
jgi:antitoxin component of RelBE/YafQ-DinJ toxin-antitoxin module